MPNWCDNVLIISGNEEALQELFENHFFKDDSASIVLCFQSILPMPQKLLKPENMGWHNWAIDNWGTKWEGINFEIISHDDGFVEVVFQTAWSPPVYVIEALGALYPELDISLRYTEDGVGFMGNMRCQNGSCIDQSITM